MSNSFDFELVADDKVSGAIVTTFQISPLMGNLQVRAFCSQFRMGAVVKVRSLITWLVRLKRQCLIRR